MNFRNKNDEEFFAILRTISKKSKLSQRLMAQELGLSLGKLNYCIKELKKKGLIKMRNFKKNKKKTNYFYILTPKGIASKTNLTINFMKRKMKEYDELKSEINISDVDISNQKIIKSNKPKIKKIDYDLL